METASTRPSQAPRPRTSPYRPAARSQCGAGDKSSCRPQSKPDVALRCATSGRIIRRTNPLTHQFHETAGSLVQRDVVVLGANADVRREIITFAIRGEHVTRVLILEI